MRKKLSTELRTIIYRVGSDSLERVYLILDPRRDLGFAIRIEKSKGGDRVTFSEETSNERDRRRFTRQQQQAQKASN